MLDKVTAITVVYKTVALARLSISSFRKFYPDLKLIVVNNSGKDDECTNFLHDFLAKDKFSMIFDSDINLGHGLGLNCGINLSSTDYLYLFDSDVEMIKGGMLNEMLKLFSPSVYGVGIIDWVTYSKGQWCSKEDKGAMMRLWVYSSMISRRMYFKFPPFDSDGGTNAAPLKSAMRAIHDTGQASELLLYFNVNEYVLHHYGGTRSKYGIPKYERLDDSIV